MLTAGYPALLKEDSDPLRRSAAFAYVLFILSIAVGQSFIWDSVGAQIGIWEFNPEKTTGLGASTLLPLEEILCAAPAHCWAWHAACESERVPRISFGGPWRRETAQDGLNTL